MARMPRRLVRIAGIAVFAAALSSGAYVFTAGGTVPPSVASYGNGDVHAFTVSQISYDIFESAPSFVTSINFTATPNGPGSTDVKAWIKVSASGGWSQCFRMPPAFPNRWHCPIVPFEEVSDVDQLRISMAQY